MDNKWLVFGSTLLALAGCMDPRSSKAERASIDTPDGIVWCQLHKPDLVNRNRAIRYPATMRASEAKAYCIAEGLRRVGSSQAQPFPHAIN